MRILWVYFNLIVYVIFHIFPIRRRYKHPERYSIEEGYKYIGNICKIIVKRSGSRVIVEGMTNLLNQPVLYVANHPSMIDPYFIGYALDRPMGAVIAGDLWFEKVPVVAPWFKSVGCVFVDRKNPRKGMQGIIKGVENIQKGHSMLLFPEGEITGMVTEEDIAPFHTGGLKLATKAGVPIIPIVITGTEKIYSAHEVIGKLLKGTVKVSFLPAYTNHLNNEKNIQEIADDLQLLMKKTIESNNSTG